MDLKVDSTVCIGVDVNLFVLIWRRISQLLVGNILDIALSLIFPLEISQRALSLRGCLMPLLILLIVIWRHHTFLLKFSSVIDVISHGVSGFFQEFTSVGGY